MQTATERGATQPAAPPVLLPQGSVYWRGVQLVKNPTDLLVFAEIVHEVMPRVIVETGTRTGGSALFLADMMTTAGVPNPRVITIDTARDENLCPIDPRIVYLTGSSTDPDVVDQVHRLIQDRVPRMVTLDSDHSAGHVFAELNAYAYMVGAGSYLIVEDTNTNGPADGLARWLPEHPEFSPDPYRERFGSTFSPGAWLRRRR